MELARLEAWAGASGREKHSVGAVRQAGISCFINVDMDIRWLEHSEQGGRTWETAGAELGKRGPRQIPGGLVEPREESGLFTKYTGRPVEHLKQKNFMKNDLFDLLGEQTLERQE